MCVALEFVIFLSPKENILYLIKSAMYTLHYQNRILYNFVRAYKIIKLSNLKRFNLKNIKIHFKITIII